MIYDYNIKWDGHIEYIINKTKYIIYILYKLAKFMQTETVRIIYYALFHSIIKYGIIAWGGAYNNNVNLLQKVQSRVIKIINKNKFIQNNPLNIKKMFALEALNYNNDTLKKMYLESSSITRNKNIATPKRDRTISIKTVTLMPQKFSIVRQLSKKMK